MTTRVEIIVYDGFDELDAVGPYEVFEMAEEQGADLDTSLVTLLETDRITAAHGLRLEPEGTLSRDDPADVVVVPGGGWTDRRPVGARAEAERGAIPEALRDLHAAGATVAGVCTGGMLLARAGLTEGRPSVTHRGALDDLRESGADVVEARVVDDGDVVTAGGITSGIDLALHLVERVAGEAVAEDVAARMEYDRREDVIEPED
ncbi:MAG: DJ-1/PfpI family protein [Halobacterium sp.]